jgi:ketosteroid isomerase-like protein
MPFTGPPAERMAIRELYDTFADGASRRDRATWLGCWTADGYWWSHHFECVGREAIAKKYDEIMQNVVAVTFFTQIGSIEINGDEARARVYCTERLVLQEGGSYRVAGRYEDELRREQGTWLFARRRYNVATEEMSELLNR